MTWLSSPLAIIAGAAIIALSIVGSSLLTPYRVAGGAGSAWRVNTITGAVEVCNVAVPGTRCL